MKSLNISKTAIFIFLVSILVISCNSNTDKVVEETYKDGSPKIEKYYKINNGQKVLYKETQYYENGNKKIEGTYKNNKRDGKWIFWFENGKLWSKGYFTEGLRTGITEVYHDNGKLFYKGEYENGKKSKTWNFYDEEGKLVNKVTFKNGELVGQTAPENKNIKIE